MAQAIVARLRRRELYKYVTDALIPAEVLERGQWVAPSPQDVVSSYRGSAVRLCADDVILQVRCGGRGKCWVSGGVQHLCVRPQNRTRSSKRTHRAPWPLLCEQENKIDYSKQRENPLDRCAGQAGSQAGGREAGPAGGQAGGPGVQPARRRRALRTPRAGLLASHPCPT